MNVNIRKGIEQSEYFIIVITESFYDDPNCIEQVLYAKNLGKPMILYIKKGIKHPIPDLFTECKVRFIFLFKDLKDVKESRDALLKTLRLGK